MLSLIKNETRAKELIVELRTALNELKSIARIDGRSAIVEEISDAVRNTGATWISLHIIIGDAQIALSAAAYHLKNCQFPGEDDINGTIKTACEKAKKISIAAELELRKLCNEQ